jgi:hypothetical protein
MADIQVGSLVRVRMSGGEILSGEVRAVVETPAGTIIRLLVGNVLYHVGANQVLHHEAASI